MVNVKSAVFELHIMGWRSDKRRKRFFDNDIVDAFTCEHIGNGSAEGTSRETWTGVLDNWSWDNSLSSSSKNLLIPMSKVRFSSQNEVRFSDVSP